MALAWWQHEAPESPRLQEMVAKVIRKEPPRTPAALAARRKMLARARSLFGGSLADEPISFEEASLLTSLYEERYYAALPFDPEALQSLWSRCAGPGTRCESGRRESEKRFGLNRPQARGPG